MTKRKSFCKMPKTLKISLAAAALALLCCASGLRADNAPDWLRAAAQDKLPDYPKDAVAVVLLDEQITTVKDNGDIETRHRFAYKLLRPESREDYGHAVVFFDNETKISFFRAWTLLPNGTPFEMKEKDATEGSSADGELFNDERYKYYLFPEANVGNVVGYEYVQRQRPFVFEDDWRFQEKIPTRRARFSLQLPPGWEFTNYWANFAQQEPQSSTGNQYVWELKDIPAVEVEPNMPPFFVVAEIGR